MFPKILTISKKKKSARNLADENKEKKSHLGWWRGMVVCNTMAPMSSGEPTVLFSDIAMGNCCKNVHEPGKDYSNSHY